jgi:hypothetical protein
MFVGIFMRFGTVHFPMTLFIIYITYGIIDE